MSDHDRNLLPEGIMAAARVGRHLFEKGMVADRLISSTANRAKDTAKVIAEQAGLNPDSIELDEKLYEGGPKAYLAAINSLPDTCESVMLFGHNPDVSYFSEYLTHHDVGSMSKGSVIAITFENLRWAEVSGRLGSVLFYVTPKELLKE